MKGDRPNMPEIYDTTTSLQNFLQHNTPGGYF